MITEDIPRQLSRRDRILDAAARTFSTEGYTAASLRDIAREAGCSLTLLDHHFGSKRDLLHAVLGMQRQLCRKRQAGLKDRLRVVAGFDFDGFIDAWVNDEFDHFRSRSGREYLHLMLRLQADREIDVETRDTLDCAEELVMEAMARAWPARGRNELRELWPMVSSALYAAVVAQVDGPDDVATRRRAVAFLVEGLRGAVDSAA